VISFGSSERCAGAGRGGDGRRQRGGRRRGQPLPGRLPQIRRREHERRERYRDSDRGPPAPARLALPENLRSRAHDEPSVDEPLIARVGREQRAIGDDVDEARNAARAAVQSADGGRREYVALRSRDPHSVADVECGVFLAERLEVIATRDSLRDLAHLGPIQEIA
jgi:hypothetical protein